MHPALALMLIGIAAPAPPGAIAPDHALICVEAPPAGTVAALGANGVAVVRDLGSCLLVVTDGAGRGRLETLGLDARLLDASIRGKSYYTVTLRGRSAAPVLEAGRVLRADGRDAVL
ncbi:MAG TPA: hypothetical protein VKU85_00640, partial [bacterium]|nr:hypothetical protein [bacterium]